MAPSVGGMASGVAGWAAVAHTAAVANSVEEAAVAGVAEVTAGEGGAQTGLLVGDAAARRAHGTLLELKHRRRVLTDRK